MSITTEEFIKRARNKHGDKYDYSKVEYDTSLDKVEIICPKHGMFLQVPAKHLFGYNYPKCVGCHHYNTKEFIELAKARHGDRYDYSKVNYKKNKLPVEIICKEHGSFFQTPKKHKKGHGCSKCSGRHHYTTEEWIEEVKKIHGDRYDYKLVKYKTNRDRVTIICSRHGKFKQLPYEHQKGSGCHKCARGVPTTEEWIEKAKSVHGDKYDYSKTIYKEKRKKVIIICPIHGEFRKRPWIHINGTGCTKCSNNGHSKASNEWIEHLMKTNISTKDKNANIYIQYAGNEGELRIDNYRVDGYCKETNIVYEFHGDFWHGNPLIYDHDDVNSVNGKTFGKLYEDTCQKEYDIQSRGYKLVVMWESDWNKMKKEL